MKLKWSDIDTKFLSVIIFFPAMLLWIAVAGKARIAYDWVTEKKTNMALTNQWRSYNFDKLRKKESSLSYWVVASENESSRPSCEWKWLAQGDWGQQPFSPNHNPPGKAIENPSGLPKSSPRPWIKHLQANLHAHLEERMRWPWIPLNKGPPQSSNTNTNATNRYKNTTQPGTLLTTLLLLVINNV